MALAKPFERTTKEVFFLECPFCKDRVQVDADNDGNGFIRLVHEYRSHYNDCPNKRHLPMREFKQLVRTETVLINQLKVPKLTAARESLIINLTEIKSKRQIIRCAKRTAERLGISLDEAIIVEKRKMTAKAMGQMLYLCSCCGHPITKEQAARSGMGPKCERGVCKCRKTDAA